MTNALLCVGRSKCNFIIVHHHLLKMAQNRAETFKNRNDYYHNMSHCEVSFAFATEKTTTFLSVKYPHQKRRLTKYVLISCYQLGCGF